MYKILSRKLGNHLTRITNILRVEGNSNIQLQLNPAIRKSIQQIQSKFKAALNLDFISGIDCWICGLLKAEWNC